VADAAWQILIILADLDSVSSLRFRILGGFVRCYLVAMLQICLAGGRVFVLDFSSSFLGLFYKVSWNLDEHGGEEKVLTVC
jgi:hypothetical protein